MTQLLSLAPVVRQDAPVVLALVAVLVAALLM